MIMPHLNKKTVSGSDCRRAFTLPELLIAVTVSALLMVSLGSALNIATRSIRPDARSAVTLDAARGLRMLQEDIRFSTRVIDHTSRSIHLLTTDADKNGEADSVEYSWSGVAGENLTRSVNGGTAVSACDNVTEFNITLATRGETQAIPSPAFAGNELLLDQQTSASSLSWEYVGYTNAIGQSLHPSSFLSTASLGDGDEWQITKIEYFAASTYWWFGSSYQFELDKSTDDGLPTHELLYRVTLDPRDISPSGSWYSIPMEGLPWLSATQGVSMTFTYSAGYDRLVLPIARDSSLSGFMTTDESSSQWLRPAGNRSLLFKVYGRIRTRPHLDQQEPARRFLMADLRLAATSLGDGPLYAAAEFLNKPLDATILAETDFSAFSITDDSNRDGQADWTLIPTSTTNSSNVVSGKWTATNNSIRLTPSIAAGQQVDVRVRCRDKTTSSGSVLIRSAVLQATGGKSISALAYLTLQPNGTQTLAVYEETGTNAFAMLSQYTMLESTLQNVRMVLNPQNKSAAVWVNGILLEVHGLGLINTPSLPSTVQLQAYNDSCEFESCSVLTQAASTADVVLP